MFNVAYRSMGVADGSGQLPMVVADGHGGCFITFGMGTRCGVCLYDRVILNWSTFLQPI